MNLYFNGSVINNLNEILEKYSSKEFKSPRRSTIYLIEFVKSKVFSEFIADFNISINSSDIHFEYKVPVARGRGNPSYSDLMIVDKTSSIAIAIEAKYLEPKYETCSKWNSSTNKDTILNGWLDLINKKTGTNVKIKDVDNFTYQMIHRLSSACSLANLNPEIVYLYFGNNSRMEAYYKEQLNELSKLFNNIKISYYKIYIPKTSVLIRLEEQWNKGVRDLSQQVKTGLIQNTLFDSENIELDKNKYGN